jgi:uncharacterized membrane protein YdjX (TVP38/TMEM64 family)
VRILEFELRRRNIGRVLSGLVLAAAIAAIYVSPVREWLTLDRLREILAQLRSLWYGPILFILVYAAACVFALPASLFVIAAGVIWGWALGGAYSLVGSMLGGTAAYFAARYIGGGILAHLGEAGRKVEKQLENAGFQTMVILRLTGLPFPVLNFAGGVARMRFGSYFMGTLVGILPSQFVIAYSADAIAGGTLSREDALVRVFVAAGLMALLVILPTWIRRRYRTVA